MKVKAMQRAPMIIGWRSRGDWREEAADLEVELLEEEDEVPDAVWVAAPEPAVAVPVEVSPAF